MPGKIDLYNIGTLGIDLTKSVIHADDGTFRQTQNAVPDSRGEFGGLAKRDGLVGINSTTAGGAIKGAIYVPLKETPKIYLGRGNEDSASLGWNTTTDLTLATAATAITSSPAPPRARLKIVLINDNADGSIGVTLNNKFYYASDDYTIDVTPPSIRVFDGTNDRELCRVPINPDTGVTTPSKAILRIITHRGFLYVSTFDSGTASANWRGSVYEVNTTTGVMTKMGTTLPTGYLPYAMTPHMGRIWVGTTSKDSTFSGRVYWMRIGAGETAWTLDHTTTAGQGEIFDIITYKGLLYIATRGNASVAALVKVRSTAGVWSTSDTAPTLLANHRFCSFGILGTNLYAGLINATQDTWAIRKFDGTSWSTVKTGGTLGQVVGRDILFHTFGTTIYAMFMNQVTPPSALNTTELYTSIDGTTWTDRDANLSGVNIPAIGVLGT